MSELVNSNSRSRSKSLSPSISSSPFNSLPNFNSPDFQRDLYGNYAQIRESTPVHVSSFNGGLRYSVLRYADVVEGLRDERLRTSSLDDATFEKLLESGNEALVNLVKMQRGFLVLLDPPAHTRLRGLVQRAFTPHAVGALRPRIETLAHKLLDNLERNRTGDLMQSFAVPLPVVVIAELLGVPAEDHVLLKRWSDQIAPILDRTLQSTALVGAMSGAHDFCRYFRPLAAARRREPLDDLISAMVAARDADDALDDEEIVAISMFLLTAGHETTSNLIGNGVQALLENPEQWSRLCNQPELVDSAVEEVLRFQSPVQRTARVTRETIEIGGHEIPAMSIVDFVFGAANRDPERFAAPETFDIVRDDNRHLALGGGIHFCLGAHLARLEGQIALRALSERFPALKVTQASPRWKAGSLLRGLESLPVSI